MMNRIMMDADDGVDESYVDTGDASPRWADSDDDRRAGHGYGCVVVPWRSLWLCWR